MTEDVSVVLWLVKDIYELFSFFALDFKYSS